jgi:ADP-heptose:LPS heptosyltransferase
MKLILRNFLSPGDIVMLTAAVRDLHRSHPGKFTTDVRTSCMELWQNNPNLTPLDESDPEVRAVDCYYPLIHQSNQRPYHFIHAFILDLNEKLALEIRPTDFRGDIHLSEREKAWPSQIEEICGEDLPFWIVASGGKHDFTNKWWDPGRYQKVIDHFRDKILFVQVGHTDHHHPALEGVIDLRGCTNLRHLVRLVYHAQGVLCGVTSLMHLAAAVPTKPGAPGARPCVVIAGGREPSHWEAYPHHQFIHTIGALPCCATGGCWKSRVLPLDDGDEKDDPGSLCMNVVGKLPRCMDMISAEEVIRRIRLYFDGGAIAYLGPRAREIPERWRRGLAACG